MGWVAMPQLVAATSNAGAFGFLALATAGPQEATHDSNQVVFAVGEAAGHQALAAA